MSSQARLADKRTVHGQGRRTDEMGGQATGERSNQQQGGGPKLLAQQEQKQKQRQTEALCQEKAALKQPKMEEEDRNGSHARSPSPCRQPKKPKTEAKDRSHMYSPSPRTLLPFCREAYTAPTEHSFLLQTVRHSANRTLLPLAESQTQR